MSMRDPLGYYQILDLTPAASEAEIKANYRERAKLWHPDHNTSEEATDKFQHLSVAYDVLKDEKSRLIYDLLSQAYVSKNFPDMSGLKIYKDRAGIENPFIRTFSLQKVWGKIVSTSVRNDDEICNALEAPAVVLKTSVSNWLLGWWGIPALFKNVQAIAHNYSAINHNRSQNLTLLIHNAVAYYQENKMEKAMLSALQAKEYADDKQKDLLEKFIRLTGVRTDKARLPHWNYAKLKMLQLVMPIMLFVVALFPLTSSVISDAELMKLFAKKDEITYFQRVKFSNGEQTFDDIVVSKVLNIPVDINDTSKLYHFKGEAKVMYGPSDKFDVMFEFPENHTVRISGVTPDSKWYRVMLDNGDMGFVPVDALEKGIGAPIPENSKIYVPSENN